MDETRSNHSPKQRASAISAVIARADSEVVKFRTGKHLTDAENRLLDKLVAQLPGLFMQPTDSATLENQNTQRDATQSQAAQMLLVGTRTNSSLSTNRTGQGANSAGDENLSNLNSQDFGATNSSISTEQIIPVVPTASIPQTGQINVSTLPAAVSEALSTYGQIWTNRYPYGFSLIYGMRTFGPYNIQNLSPYNFSPAHVGGPEMCLVAGLTPAEAPPGSIGSSAVPLSLPVLRYQGATYSKPAHPSWTVHKGAPYVDGDGRLRRPWHIVPVATYVDAQDGLNVAVLGNGPDPAWQPNLLQYIDAHRTEINTYFPGGCYMVDVSGRELNIFQSADPNFQGLWTRTSVSQAGNGWVILFPTEVLNAKRVETLELQQMNQLISITIETSSGTHKVGAIGFTTYTGPAFFMGLLDN
jgi:hypothetical protein